MEMLDRPLAHHAPADQFTGEVYYEFLVPVDGRAQGRCNYVHFAPGARTAWHRHCNGQTLHVTHGTCVTQSRGGDAVVARTGQTVWCPPDEWHWHGATPGEFMTHLAIWDGLAEGQDGPETDWGAQVTGDEYAAAAAVITES